MKTGIIIISMLGSILSIVLGVEWLSNYYEYDYNNISNVIFKNDKILMGLNFYAKMGYWLIAFGVTFIVYALLINAMFKDLSKVYQMIVSIVIGFLFISIGVLFISNYMEYRNILNLSSSLIDIYDPGMPDLKSILIGAYCMILFGIVGIIATMMILYNKLKFLSASVFCLIFVIPPMFIPQALCVTFLFASSAIMTLIWTKFLKVNDTLAVDCKGEGYEYLEDFYFQKQITKVRIKTLRTYNEIYTTTTSR